MRSKLATLFLAALFVTSGVAFASPRLSPNPAVPAAMSHKKKTHKAKTSKKSKKSSKKAKKSKKHS